MKTRFRDFLKVTELIVKVTRPAMALIVLAGSALNATETLAQSAKGVESLEQRLQKKQSEKERLLNRATEIRCLLGTPEGSERARCPEILKKSADSSLLTAAPDCSKHLPGSLRHQLCEIEKEMVELRKNTPAPDNQNKPQLQNLEQRKQEIVKNIQGLEKELSKIPSEIKKLDQEIANIEKDLGKDEKLRTAEENYRLARDELREAARDIPKEASAEERKKILAPYEQKVALAAREKWKAEQGVLTVRREQIKSDDSNYSQCIAALSAFSPNANPPINLREKCAGIAPTDANFDLAQSDSKEAQAERTRILESVKDAKNRELQALKDAERAAYDEMLLYADTTKECGYSKQAGNSWACETAAKTAEYGTLAAAAAQQVAGVALQIKGGENLQKLNPQSGYSDMYETAAQNADSAAETSRIVKYATGAIAAAQTLSGATALVNNTVSGDLQGEASKEHVEAGIKAIMSGVASGALAYQYHLHEEMMKREAEALRKIRDGYRGLEGLQIGKSPDPLADRGQETPFQNPFQDIDSSKQGASQDLMKPEEYASKNGPDVPPPSLGEPINTGGGAGNPNRGTNTPMPVAGGVPQGGGSPMMGGFFGGSGQGGQNPGIFNSSENGDGPSATHQYAGLGNNPSKYTSGGGGGGSTRGGSSGPAGVDLSSMLAKFLPGLSGGKEDEKSYKRGILSFGRKPEDRQPASNHSSQNKYDQDLSQVDRSRSLFERVHMAYQLKQKENAI